MPRRSNGGPPVPAGPQPLPSRWVPLADGRVDLVLGTVERGADPVRLTALEQRLLQRLHDDVNQVVSRDTLLEDVWEIPAVTLTRAVDSTVRRLRVKIEVDPSQPAHLLKVHGEGYRLCPAERERVPSRVVQASPHFFGRDAALARLAGPLPALLSIVGLRGIGKSRLVQEAADRTWLMVALGQARSDSELRTAVALAVEGRPRNASPEAVVELLQGHPVVVFDEAENVLDPLREVVRQLLARPNAPRIVLTSQRHLGLPREVVWTLEPLDDSGSRALFRHVSGCPDDPRLPSVLAQLDGHPLALELAAGWWRPLGWDGLEHTLARHLVDLPSTQAGARSEHHSLGTAVRWALDRLGERPTRALERLTPFQRTLDVPIASFVLETSPVEALALLAELARHHLARPVEGGWRLVAPVRQALPTTDAIRDRHAATVAHFVHALARDANTDPAARRALKTWLPDGILAVTWWLPRDPEAAAALVPDLGPALLAHGPLDVVRTWLDHPSVPSLPAHQRGALLRFGVEACLGEGDLGAALTHLQQVVQHHPCPETSLQQGVALQLAEAHDAARAAYEDAARGPIAIRLLAAAGLASLDNRQGDPARALERTTANQRIARQHRLAFQEALLGRQQGRALCLLGELAAAREALLRARATFASFAETRLGFLTLCSLVEVELRLARVHDAERLLDELRTLLARHPVGAWEAVVELLAGSTRLFSGSAREAAAHFDRALSLLSREQLEQAARTTHAWAAVTRFELDEHELAQAHLAAALGPGLPIGEVARCWLEGAPCPASCDLDADLLSHCRRALASV